MLWGRPVLVMSLAATALITGARQLGVLERWELSAYDQFVRSQPDPAPDPRLLVVAITEADIQALKQWPVSDQTLSQALTKLESYQPRVIGLDIYRDVPISPGNIELKTDLQINDKVVAVCQSSGADHTGVAPPPTVPTDRLGFSDFVVDPDGIVRRYLMFLTPAANSQCRASTAFSLQLALRYLNHQSIQWQKTPLEELQIGATRFPPLQQEVGGYRNLDARGYQILLRYRSPSTVARQVNLQDLLGGHIDPAWVKDKIVLIGVTAPSGNDFHLTPYSAGQPRDFRMPGVILHTQMVSQILGAVLDQQSLIWTAPAWVEILWTWGWTLLGASLAWQLRRPLWLAVSGALALGVLTGSCLALFTLGGWIAIVPPALSLGTAIMGAIAYKSYQLSGNATLRPEPAPTLQVSLPNPVSSPTHHSSDSTSTEAPANLLLGRYEMIAPLSNGRGGFGQTYLAKDIKRPGSPECVVKQLQPRQTDLQHLQVARALFQREAETLEAVGAHDQIPRLLAYFEENSEFYIVQECIRGKALSELLSPGERLPTSQVVALLKDVLPVLDFIHGRGVIHRDLKPANLIQRDRDRRMVLIDFGAVKLLQARITEQTLTSSSLHHPSTIIGTPGYAAPEQMLGEPVYSSDLYALGMIGIQALTGKTPSQLSTGSNSREILWRDQAQVQSELAAILDKMTRPDPQERFQTASEVLQQLQGQYSSSNDNERS